MVDHHMPTQSEPLRARAPSRLVRRSLASSATAAAVLLMSLLGLPASPTRAVAQGGTSLWFGGGSVSSGPRQLHTAAQLDMPLFPAAARAEVLWMSPLGDDPLSAVVASGVLELGMAPVAPYLIGGWGRYGLEEETIRDGLSVGAGVRFGSPELGLFGQIRRHEPVDATTVSLGVTF